MHLHDNPALTVAFALAAGTAGQALAHHLRLPGIVVLLVFGALLGPDVAAVVQPQSLGTGLPALVGFAVAIILFEGGMSLDMRRLRREGRAIRQLISVGALISLVVGMILAMLVLGWEWERSLLFGTLVIVTGPTVVTPLLRRLRAKKSVTTVLEAEGVLIDAVGAITAAVALEFVVTPTGSEGLLALPTIGLRLVFGTVAGLIGGLVIALILRVRGLIPEGLENVFTLGFAVFVFELSNAVMHESGIAAVTVAGLVVGNMRSYATHHLREFKEQLTAMLIGMLFVLLVADVRIADVMALGVPGAIVAGCSILLIRPLSVAAGTWGTTLSAKERVFVGWIGPRGIVAAAVASIFGFELEHAGKEGGVELKALVFLVIAVTVLWSALTGPLAARFLGLKRKSGAGWVIVGGNALARKLSELLHHQGNDVLAIDNDPEHVKPLEAMGVQVVQGNALEHHTHEEAALDTRAGAIACTGNEDVNYLFGEKARAEHRTLRYGIALTRWDEGVTHDMVEDLGAEVLFGTAIDIHTWSERVEAGQTRLEWWEFVGGKDSPNIFVHGDKDPLRVALLHRRKGHSEPVTNRVKFRSDSQVAFLVDVGRAQESAAELQNAGWRSRDSRSGEHADEDKSE